MESLEGKGKVTCHPGSRHKGSWPPSRRHACLQTAVDENGKDGDKYCEYDDEDGLRLVMRIDHQVTTDFGKLVQHS